MHKIPSKHWTEFLSEVGKPVLVRGYRQLDRLRQIERKMEELNQLKMEYNQKEKEIAQLCTTEWSTKEIANAKLKSITP